MRNVVVTRGRTGLAISAVVLAATVAGATLGASAQSHLPLADRNGVFPDGQEWQITVPANWNGTVINDLDRISNRSGRADFFLPRGYAYTGTRRHPDRGSNWDPRAESNNMVRILDLFEAEFGRPEHTIQFGCSGGGSVALSVAEDHPQRFDGVIAMHATSPISLANMRLDLTFALKTLLDSDDQLPLIVTSRPTGPADTAWVNFLAAAEETAEGRARMALAGVLAQYPAWGSQSDPVPKPRPEDKAGVREALLKVVVDGARRAVTSRPQWDQPAGLMSWNTGVDYRQFYANARSGSQADRSGLVRRNRAAHRGGPRSHQRRHPDRSESGSCELLEVPDSIPGSLECPCCTFRTSETREPRPRTCPPHEELVTRAGKNALYRQAFIDAPGHCTFNTAEMAAAVGTLVQRIERGAWDDIVDPGRMNAVGRSFGLGEPRFIHPGPESGLVAAQAPQSGILSRQPWPFGREPLAACGGSL